jgi:hypothetical protein
LFISGDAFIKIDKSLTYRGDNSTDHYHSHKIFPEVFPSVWMIHKNGKSRNQKKVPPGPAPKRMLRERKRKNEKNSLLEFLESGTRRLVNQISKDNE